MGVTVHVKCAKCGALESLHMSLWDAGSSFFTGEVHKAIPEGQLPALKNLLSQRRTGWNTYADTLCREAARAGYARCKADCDGLITVSLLQ